MASLQTVPSGLSTPLNGGKTQDGPYQIELEDIESDETNTTNPASTTVSGTESTHVSQKSTHVSPMKPSAMKPESHYSTGFTGTGQNDAEPPSRSSTYLVRALVCAFAILLLWITSLNISKVFVVSIVHSPDTQTVVDDWNYLATETVAIKSGYSDCGTQQVERCNRTLLANTNNMLNGIAANTAINKNTLAAAQTIAATCSSLTIELSQSIAKWKDKQPFEQIQYNQSCTVDEINEIKVWVDRPDLIHNEAYILADTYSKDVDSRSNRMLAYVQNYTDYNVWYFTVYKPGAAAAIYNNLGGMLGPFADEFGNITMGILAPASRLVDCMSMAQTAAAACPNGARAAWDAGSASVRSSYINTRAKLEITSNLYRSTTSSMQAMLGAIKSFFDNFLAPAASSIAALGVPLGSFPSTTFGIPNAPALPPDVAWLDPDFTFINTTQHISAFAAAVAASASNSRNTAAQWAASQANITDGLPTFMEDYNPPPLLEPMTAEVAAQHDSSTDYRADSAYALNQQAAPTTKNDTVKVITGFLGEKAEAFTNMDFSIEPLGGNLLLAPLLDVIPSLYLFALAIDYIWRAYRSVRLIIKYWFQSGVGLPVIDVRDYENHEGARGPVKAVTLLTHPGTVITVIVIILALALASIIPPYTSILDAYIEGCIESQDGTVVTNNTFAIAFNYAQSDGNKILNEGNQQLDASRNQICGKYLQKSSDEANADLATLASATTAQSKNSYQVFQIHKCVNFSNFGNPNTYNATYYGARHPLLIIADAMDENNNDDDTHPCMPASMSGFKMLPAIFNCTEIPPCPIPCSAQKASIQAASRQAGCRTEYLLHSFLARFWVTLLVFFSLNISRMLFMAAIVRLGWRSLTPRGFEFVSNCTRVGETSKTINAQLVVQLNKAIASYERFAIFLFGLAILVHIPYIVVLSTINQTLEYK